MLLLHTSASLLHLGHRLYKGHTCSYVYISNLAIVKQKSFLTSGRLSRVLKYIDRVQTDIWFRRIIIIVIDYRKEAESAFLTKHEWPKTQLYSVSRRPVVLSSGDLDNVLAEKAT